MQVQVMRFKQRRNKKEEVLYLGILPAAELVHKADIDEFRPDNKEGYQRTLDSRRVKGLSNYVKNEEGLLPTAILVNVRSQLDFIPVMENSNVGKLNIPEDETLWIVDGQHRFRGLELAMEQSDEPLAYDLPVVFSSDFDRELETDVFYVVNTKQQGVPTDLTAEIIAKRTAISLKARQEALERGDTKTAGSIKIRAVDLYKTVGVSIAEQLRNDPGAWNGKIRTGNEPKDVEKPMRINTFASTLKPFLMDRWVKKQYEGTGAADRLGPIVHTYWEALNDLMPEAFYDIKNYAVQRPLGVYVFHELLPDVVERVRMEDDWSQESFSRQLEKLGPWVRSDKWHLQFGEPIMRANNRATIKYILEQMAPLLNKTPEHV